VIRIVACGVGNVRAYLNLFKSMGVSAAVATSAADLADASRLILPGVGSFDWTMSRLHESGMKDDIAHCALVKRIPVLAVCVGMQILGTRSEEGEKAGLGWIRADVRKFKPNGEHAPLPLPHMGWNDVGVVRDTGLFRGLESDARFYFLHSYYVEPADEQLAIATSEYHGPFVCAIQRDNIFGVQFHPEKSHQWGERLLHNFARL